MGTKLQKTVDYNTYQVITDYRDGYQYETKPDPHSGRGYAKLLFFPTAEGYVKAVYSDDMSVQTPVEYQYIYIYKDHLGNNRLSYTLDPETNQIKILEENHYYPFGLKHAAYNQTRKDVKYKEQAASKKEVKQVVPEAVKFKYLYNGKELQDELGLNWYDYGARNYQADLGRWFNVDPLAEKYASFSSYNYTFNNPIRFIDTDGQKIVIANNTNTALTNLAKIVATRLGRQRINRLISSPFTYTARSVFWSSSSAYDGSGEIGLSRTFYYVGSPWRPYVDGGTLSSMYAMGHELNHAYDHDMTFRAGNREREARETSSVNFTNYLRSVYGDGDDLRTRYSGLGLRFADNENFYNRQNEKVTDFTQTFDVSFGGNTVMGFSYNTSTNGEEPTNSYIISIKTKSGQYAYRIFNSKKEYNAAVERIQNLKKKEDEKK